MRVPIVVIAMMSLVLPGVLAGEGTPATQAQPAHWEPFEGMIHGCSSTGADDLFLTPGGVLHFKGGSNVNLWVTDHPLVNGIERNIVDANINFNAGVGRAQAIATLTPEGIGGSWDLRFLVRVGGGGASGGGKGRGALEGLRIEFDVEPMPGSPNECTPGFAFVARVRGTVRGDA